MIPQEQTNEEKVKGRKETNIALITITICILLYIAYVNGIGIFAANKNVTLQMGEELITLSEKEETFIGLNNKQIIKITADGINAYSFEGTEIWADTFSVDNFEVQQKEPYIAIGGKQGKTIVLYSTKGKLCEITTVNPIVYFSVNEAGGIVTVESSKNAYTISAYDKSGKFLCSRVSYTSTDGYPTAAVLSPDNELLLMSYVSVDEPQVTSSILAMEVEGVSTEDKVDNIAFGYIESNNLVYSIEYINNDTWVCVGDKAITWYDNNGQTKGKQSNLSLVFVPEIIKKSSFGSGYFPVVYSEKPTQSVVHRQDKLAYYDEVGQLMYSVTLEGGAQSHYADDDGVVINVNGTYRGFNKLCNQIFEYSPTIDINKVVYVPTIKKGIAVGKDKVYLLIPKKEKNK